MEITNSIHASFKSTLLKLKALYPDGEARAMADRLFEHYLGLTPARRIISGKNLIDADNLILLETATSKLLNHIPLQYILGKAWFMELEFDVNPFVLIPRPETEELVSLIIKEQSGGKSIQPVHILDIGTGSGCIAIALKHNLPESDVAAIDVSSEAIEVARTNAAKNSVAVDFILTDILDHSKWDDLPQSDIIVSNPPYVTNAEKTLMHPNVLDYEPHKALFVPDHDPLLFYREIMEFAKVKLSPTGSLWFEINEMFGDELRNMALNQGFGEANIIFDFRGKSRFLHVIK